MFFLSELSVGSWTAFHGCLSLLKAFNIDLVNIQFKTRLQIRNNFNNESIIVCFAR